jgi:glutamate-1-semialdehyde 2,1-aminomutase
MSVLARPSLVGGDMDEREPHWVDRAAGPYLWDDRGRRFIDLILGYGSVILGHADPSVTEAVVAAIRRGVSPTLRHQSQIELAELLTRTVPHADAAILFKTGSEATAATVRLARAFTGRDVVLRWGYQGWHDWCAPRARGVPVGYRRLTVELPFDDVDAVHRAYGEHRGRVAAMILMAMDDRPPDPGYLAECRALADRHDALLILDEIRTGFRIALGGAQAYYGVRADLATFSKALGNGHPISAVTGRADVMRTVSDVSMSSLYSRSTDGIAAALATVDCLASSDVLGRVWTSGRRIQDGLRSAATRAGVPVRTLGLPPMPFHEFDLPTPARQRAEDAFYATVWRAGVLLHRTHHWFVCRDLTEADIDEVVSAGAAGYAAAAATV